jgi:hypothetical protein
MAGDEPLLAPLMLLLVIFAIAAAAYYVPRVAHRLQDGDDFERTLTRMRSVHFMGNIVEHPDACEQVTLASNAGYIVIRDEDGDPVHQTPRWPSGEMLVAWNAEPGRYYVSVDGEYVERMLIHRPHRIERLSLPPSR